MSSDMETSNKANNNIIYNENVNGEIIVSAKCDKTLKSNIDAKDDTIRKRTSLLIVPQNDANDNQNTVMTDSAIDNENAHEIVIESSTMKSTKTKSLESSICSSSRSATSNDEMDEDENMKKRHSNISNRNSIVSVDSCVSQTTHSSSRSHSSATSSSGDDVVIADYHDLENGNILDEFDESERKNCISNASSSIEDYSLREQYKNFINDNKTINLSRSVEVLASSDKEQQMLTNEMEEPLSLPPCDSLLSPQEVPMGRRYAEVSQFKSNKR